MSLVRCLEPQFLSGLGVNSYDAAVVRLECDGLFAFPTFDFHLLRPSEAQFASGCTQDGEIPRGSGLALGAH